MYGSFLYSISRDGLCILNYFLNIIYMYDPSVHRSYTCIIRVTTQYIGGAFDMFHTQKYHLPALLMQKLSKTTLYRNLFIVSILLSGIAI